MPTVVQEPLVPEPIRALGALSRTDYVDLFVATTAEVIDATPERLAREAVEGASPLGRFLAWRLVCGLRLDAPPSADTIAGWRIDGRGPTWVRLAANSWFMSANMVFLVEGQRASFATFIGYDRAVAALIWGGASAGHRAVAPALLGGAVKRVQRSVSPQTPDGGPV